MFLDSAGAGPACFRLCGDLASQLSWKQCTVMSCLYFFLYLKHKINDQAKVSTHESRLTQILSMHKGHGISTIVIQKKEGVAQDKINSLFEKCISMLCILIILLKFMTNLLKTSLRCPLISTDYHNVSLAPSIIHFWNNKVLTTFKQ